MRGEGTAEDWREVLPPFAVVVAGLLLAIAIFFFLRGYYAPVERQQFRRNPPSFATPFNGDIARHVTSLAAIKAFVTASHVTRWQFSTYAHQILPLNMGLRAVLWVPKVANTDRRAYEASLQQDGLYGLKVRELTDKGDIADVAERPSYTPISYVEPFDGNLNLVGLDISRIPRYAELFDEASQSGR